MSLLSLIAAFLIEQFLPLNYRKLVANPVNAWLSFVAARFNMDSYRHGVLAFGVAVLFPVLLLACCYLIAYTNHRALAFALNVLVLYFTMGFRQFSHHYTGIQKALYLDNLDEARRLFGEWQGQDAARLSAKDITKRSIEAALLASHRHVFAVLLWFVLLPGPVGALLYRMALLAKENFMDDETRQSIVEPLSDILPGIASQQKAKFSLFAQQAFMLIEWLPLRVTAFAFAFVGNFEDAMHAWRDRAKLWADHDAGIVVSSGSGALGVAFADVSSADQSSTEVAANVMENAVGLVWRAAAFWLFFLFLLVLAHLAG